MKRAQPWGKGRTDGEEGNDDRGGRGDTGGRGGGAGHLAMAISVMTARWRDVVLGSTLFCAVVWGGSAMAASSPASSLGPHPATLTLDLVVMMRQGNTVTIYQQAEFAPHEPDQVFGVLSGATGIRALAGRITAIHGDVVTVTPQQGSATVVYRVPWSSHQVSTALQNPGTIDTVRLLLGPGLRLPAAANPVWAFLGTGALSAKVATVFSDYETTQVHAGQSLPLLLKAGTPTTASPVLGKSSSAPVGIAGDVALGLLGLVAGSGWILVYHHRQRARRPAASGVGEVK